MKTLIMSLLLASSVAQAASEAAQFECVSAIGVRGPEPTRGRFYQGPTLNQFYTGDGGIDARVPGYDLVYYMKDKGNGVFILDTGSDTMAIDNTAVGTMSLTAILGLTQISLLGSDKPSTCVLSVWAIACGKTATQAQAGLSKLIANNPVGPAADMPPNCTNGQTEEPSGLSGPVLPLPPGAHWR